MQQSGETYFNRFSDAWPHVTFLTGMIFFSMYSRLLLAPLLVFIQIDLAIGPADATRLFLPLSIAYATAMIGSGYLAEIFYHRRTIALSAIVLGAGLIMISLAHAIWVLYIAVTLVGAGSGLYPPSGVAALTTLVDDRIRGRAIALHEVGPNVAFVVAPLAVTIGTTLADWRWVTAVSGAVAIVLGIAFDRHARAGRFAGQRPLLGTIGPLIRKPEFWAIAVFFALAASSTIGVYSILPTFLVQTRGYAVAPMNTLLSISRISGIVVVLIAGVLVDRIGVARLIAGVFLLTGALTLAIGFLDGPAMLVVVFLQPLVISAFFPAAVGAMADLGPPHLRNVAVSIIIPGVNVISNGVFPAIMGALTEQGIVETGFVGLGATMVAALALTPFLTHKTAG